MCVYYESLCRDRCLQWSWVICLHYTTVAQPPRTIIYSDLPKHTHPETGSMLGAKTLYTRPGLEHIMAFSGLSWCNLTPKQRTPQTKATSFTHVFLFYLHLCQHACKNSCSSQLNSLRFNSCWPLWPAFCSGAAAWPRVSLTVLHCWDVVTKRSKHVSYQFLQTEFYRNPLNTAWHVLSKIRYAGFVTQTFTHVYRLVICSFAHSAGWKRVGGWKGLRLWFTFKDSLNQHQHNVTRKWSAPYCQYSPIRDAEYRVY